MRLSKRRHKMTSMGLPKQGIQPKAQTRFRVTQVNKISSTCPWVIYNSNSYQSLQLLLFFFSRKGLVWTKTFISFLYEDYIFLITKLYLLWNIKQDNSRHVTVSLCCLPLILYKLKERWVYNLKNYKALFQLITFILFWIENRRLILTLTRKLIFVI